MDEIRKLIKTLRSHEVPETEIYDCAKEIINNFGTNRFNKGFDEGFEIGNYVNQLLNENHE